MPYADPSPHADEAPIMLRDKALKDALILRLLAAVGTG
jgi:hypothetical protein